MVFLKRGLLAGFVLASMLLVAFGLIRFRVSTIERELQAAAAPWNIAEMVTVPEAFERFRKSGDWELLQRDLYGNFSKPVYFPFYGDIDDPVAVLRMVGQVHGVTTVDIERDVVDDKILHAIAELPILSGLRFSPGQRSKPSKSTPANLLDLRSPAMAQLIRPSTGFASFHRCRLSNEVLTQIASVSEPHFVAFDCCDLPSDCGDVLRRLRITELGNFTRVHFNSKNIPVTALGCLRGKHLRSLRLELNLALDGGLSYLEELEGFDSDFLEINVHDRQDPVVVCDQLLRLEMTRLQEVSVYGRDLDGCGFSADIDWQNQTSHVEWYRFSDGYGE